jgi:hypothetical protein
MIHHGNVEHVDVAQALRLKHQLEQQEWNSKYQQSRKLAPPSTPSSTLSAPPPGRGKLSTASWAHAAPEKHSHVEVLKAQLQSVSKENEEYRQLTAHLKQSLEVNARLDAEKRLEQASRHNEQYANLTQVLSQHLAPTREIANESSLPQPVLKKPVATLPKAITDRMDRAITNSSKGATAQSAPALRSDPPTSQAMVVAQSQPPPTQAMVVAQSQPPPTQAMVVAQSQLPTLRSRNKSGSGGNASDRLKMWRTQKARQVGLRGIEVDSESAAASGSNGENSRTRARAERLGRQVAGEQAEIYLQRLAVQEAQTLLKEVQMQRMETQHEQLQVQ